jgi:hypothetical protein
MHLPRDFKVGMSLGLGAVLLEGQSWELSSGGPAVCNDTAGRLIQLGLSHSSATQFTG